MISEYVERLARELDFDPSLSRCVRREVEDHLWEAVAADPEGGGLEAERRAVANFGDPHVIAAQFAVVSLAKHAKRVGVVAVVLIAAVFIAMKARLAWYAVMECPAGEMGGLGDIVVSIDRYAFWLSVFLGMAGWMYIDSRRVPAAFTQEFRGQLSRFFRLCSAATGALIASVISDGRPLDGGRNRECGCACFVSPRHDAANGVHGSYSAHVMRVGRHSLRVTP